MVSDNVPGIKRKLSDAAVAPNAAPTTGRPDGDDGYVPLPIQTFLWRQTSPFLRPRLGKLCEASSVSFERVVVQNISHGLSPSLCEAIKSVTRWQFVQAALPHVMHCVAAVLAERNRKMSPPEAKFDAIETKLLYTLHWMFLDAASECRDADLEKVKLEGGDATQPDCYAHELPSIQLFVYLFAPLVSTMGEQPFQTLKLENGLRIWQALWTNSVPDVASFAAPVKASRNTLLAARQTQPKPNAGDIYLGHGLQEARKIVRDPEPAPSIDRSDAKRPTAPATTTVFDCDLCGERYARIADKFACKCGSTSFTPAQQPAPAVTAAPHLSPTGNRDQPAKCAAETDPLLATFLDVAVLRCLFCPHWNEPGTFWALQFMQKRLSTVQEELRRRHIVRNRSRSLPVPKFLLQFLAEQRRAAACGTREWLSTEHVGQQSRASLRLQPQAAAIAGASVKRLRSRCHSGVPDADACEDAQALSTLPDADSGFTSPLGAGRGRSYTDSLVQYSSNEECVEVLGSVHYIQENGQLNYSIVLRALHCATHNHISPRMCDVVVRTLRALLQLRVADCERLPVCGWSASSQPPDEEQSSLSMMLDVVFRVVRVIGCPHCHQLTNTEELRGLVAACLLELHEHSPAEFKQYIGGVVSQQSIQFTLDLLHSYSGFCAEAGMFSLIFPLLCNKTETTCSSKYNYANSFGQSEAGNACQAGAFSYQASTVKWSMDTACNTRTGAREAAAVREAERVLIGYFLKPLVTRLCNAKAQLVLPEHSAVCVDVCRLLVYVNEMHGSTFRKVLLSGPLETVRDLRKQQEARVARLHELQLLIARVHEARNEETCRPRTASPCKFEALSDGLGARSPTSNLFSRKKVTKRSITSIGLLGEGDAALAPAGSCSAPATAAVLNLGDNCLEGAGLPRRTSMAYEAENSADASRKVDRQSNHKRDSSVAESEGRADLGMLRARLARADTNTHEALRPSATRRRHDWASEAWSKAARSERARCRATLGGSPPPDGLRTDGGPLQALNEQLARLTEEYQTLLKRRSPTLSVARLSRGLRRFDFILQCLPPGAMPDGAMLAAMLDLDAPLIARASILLQCAFFVSCCNRDDWPVSARSDVAPRLRTCQSWTQLLQAAAELVPVTQLQFPSVVHATGAAQRLQLRLLAAVLFRNWAELLAARLEYFIRKDAAATDVDERDADDDLLAQPARRSACPYALKVLTVHLLLEITAFLRETYRSLPRAGTAAKSTRDKRNSQQPQLLSLNDCRTGYRVRKTSGGQSRDDGRDSQNNVDRPSRRNRHGAQALASPDRSSGCSRSSISEAAADRDTSSTSGHRNEIPPDNIVSHTRRISFMLAEQPHRSLSTGSTCSNVSTTMSPSSKEDPLRTGTGTGTGTAQSPQKAPQELLADHVATRKFSQNSKKMHRMHPLTSSSSMRVSRHTSVKRTADGRMTRTESVKSGEKDTPADSPVNANCNVNANEKTFAFAASASATATATAAASAPTQPSMEEVMAHTAANALAQLLNGSFQPENNMPWTKVVIMLANCTDFHCTHEAACSPNCYVRQRRACAKLVDALKQVYSAQETSPPPSSSAESNSNSNSNCKSQSTGFAPPKKNNAHDGSGTFPGTPTRQKSTSSNVEVPIVFGDKSAQAKAAEKSDSKLPKSEQAGIYDYLESRMKNMIQASLSIINKSCLFLQEEHFVDILPVAWELLLETDQEIASAAAVVIILASIKASEKTQELIFKELQHEEPDKRINAILRFQQLWKYRYHVWSRMEIHAASSFKIPPPAIDYVPPSPTLGIAQLNVIDPPWLPQHKVRVDEVTVNHEVQASFVAAKTTRKKQHKFMLQRAFHIEEEKRHNARQRFSLTNVPLSLQAAHEPALHHNEEHEDNTICDVKETGLHIPNVQLAQSVFPSRLCAAIVPMVNLLHDYATNHEGVSVAQAAERVVWQCLLEDPVLFLRYILEKLTNANKRDEMITVAKKLILGLGDIPMQAAHALFNYTLGMIMFYSRSPCEGGQEAISAALSLLWLIVPYGCGLVFKDLKQTLRKEQCDPNVMITANLPFAKKLIVHGPDVACVPSQFPVQEETQFKQIFDESCEFFNIPEDKRHLCALMDAKCRQMYNSEYYIRDFYFFRRNYYPQLSLVQFPSQQMLQQRLVRNVFQLKLVEVGKSTLAFSLLKHTPNNTLLSHVYFLYDELSKLPQFPRRSLECEFALYSMKSGHEVVSLDQIHKYSWSKLISELFISTEQTFAWTKEIGLFINVINGTLILHAEDTGVLRLCLASYINIALQFKSHADLNGYSHIMPTVMRVYCLNENNSVIREAIELTCRQFYQLHRKPFVLQLFGAIADFLECSDQFCATGASLPQYDAVHPQSLFRLLQAIQVETADRSDIMNLVVADKPLKPLDFCYQDEPQSFSYLDTFILCISVVAYACDSRRSVQMLSVLEALLPFYLKHIRKQVDEKATAVNARSEIQAILQLTSAVKTLISACDALTRNFSGPQRAADSSAVAAVAATLTGGSAGQSAAPSSVQGSIRSASKRNRAVKSRHSVYYQDDCKRPEESQYIDDDPASTSGHKQRAHCNPPPPSGQADEEEQRQCENFCRPRNCVLSCAAEYLTTCTARIKYLSTVLNDPNYRYPEMLDAKSFVKLTDIAGTILKLSLYDPPFISAIGIQRYFLDIFPVITWTEDSIRPVLNGILRRLDRYFHTINKRPILRKNLNWAAVANVLTGLYTMIQRYSFIVHNQAFKPIATNCFTITITGLATSSTSSTGADRTDESPAGRNGPRRHSGGTEPGMGDGRRLSQPSMQNQLMHVPPEFTSCTVKLLLQLIEIGGETYSLESICTNMLPAEYMSGDRLHLTLLNLLLPACLRAGACNRLDIFRTNDLRYLVGNVLSLLSSIASAQPQPQPQLQPPGNSHIIGSALTGLQIPPASMIVASASSYAVGAGSFRNEKVRAYAFGRQQCAVALFGLKVLALFFEKQLKSDMHQVARVLMERSKTVLHAFPEFWRFLDFLVVSRVGLFATLLPFIRLRVFSSKPTDEQICAIQSAVQRRLQRAAQCDLEASRCELIAALTREMSRIKIDVTSGTCSAMEKSTSVKSQKSEKKEKKQLTQTSSVSARSSSAAETHEFNRKTSAMAMLSSIPSAHASSDKEKTWSSSSYDPSTSKSSILQRSRSARMSVKAEKQRLLNRLTEKRSANVNSYEKNDSLLHPPLPADANRAYVSRSSTSSATTSNTDDRHEIMVDHKFIPRTDSRTKRAPHKPCARSSTYEMSTSFSRSSASSFMSEEPPSESAEAGGDESSSLISPFDAGLKLPLPVTRAVPIGRYPNSDLLCNNHNASEGLRSIDLQLNKLPQSAISPASLTSVTPSPSLSASGFCISTGTKSPISTVRQVDKFALSTTDSRALTSESCDNDTTTATETDDEENIVYV